MKKLPARIAIIGNAGSGKSTLAQGLHRILKLPVHHLDKYFWKPQWIYPNPDDYRVIHHTLCNGDAWIIDGMNLRLLDYRMQRADVIIFLDVPRYICFWRIFVRLMRYYGKIAPHAPEGCPEGLSWKFVKFLKWVWSFKKQYRPKVLEMLHQGENKAQCYILRSQKEVNLFVEKIIAEKK